MMLLLQNPLPPAEQPKPKFRFSETARMLLLQIMSANIEIQDRLTDKAMAEAGFDECEPFAFLFFLNLGSCQREHLLLTGAAK